MPNLDTRISNLTNRRLDTAPGMTSFAFSESSNNVLSELRSFGNTKIEKYINGSMAPVNARSTEISFEQGERVKKQLEENLPVSVNNLQYRFQGSVICNTHIEAVSDIDLLAILQKFEYNEAVKPLSTKYEGNPFSDVKSLKTEAAQVLKKTFPVASVLIHAKSLEIKGGSLLRKVDIVPSAWNNSVLYDTTGDETYRGVKIFDTNNDTHSTNFPFQNKKLVEDKDRETAGNYRKLVRFMKTLKADSDSALFKQISSYDIQAIIYCLMEPNYRFLMPAVRLVPAIRQSIGYLIQNSAYFNNLKVPDQTRYISEKVTHPMLIAMFNEIKLMEDELLKTTH